MGREETPQFVRERIAPPDERIKDPVVRAILENVLVSDKSVERTSGACKASSGFAIERFGQVEGGGLGLQRTLSPQQCCRAGPVSVLAMRSAPIVRSGDLLSR